MTSCKRRPAPMVACALAALALLSAGAAQAQVELPRGVIRGNPLGICGHQAFVANSYSDTLSVIDLRTHRLTKQLPTGARPVNPTFNRDWTRLVVANARGGTLTMVDTKSAKVIDTIPAGGDHPSGLRFLPDGRHLVISFLGEKVEDQGWLGVLDLQTRKLVKTIPVQARSERFDITPDGKRAYVANLIAQTISVVDLDKGAVIATIPSPERFPFNVLMSHDGARVFVASTLGGSIIEIDTATNKVVNTIKTAPGPNGMAFTPDGFNILITTVYSGRLQAYNRSANVLSEGSFVGLLPGFIRLAPDGLKGMFARPYGRQVSIFDATTMQIIENVETGEGPSTVAICGNP